MGSEKQRQSRRSKEKEAPEVGMATKRWLKTYLEKVRVGRMFVLRPAK